MSLPHLLQAYQDAVASGEIYDSGQQRQILNAFQQIITACHQVKKTTPWWRFHRTKRPALGLYLYGPVGSGKTYLMDLFYQHLGHVPKKRIHFHHFMQQVDAFLRSHQGLENPLQIIADELLKDIHVLCLDEFLVEDITVASILAELLRIIFSKSIILITTANTKPEDLYLDGLHRSRFLPAIALIQQHTKTYYLNDHRDYRVGRPPLEHTFLYPDTVENQQKMRAAYLNHTHVQTIEPQQLSVQSRMIDVIACHQKTVWFDFNVICQMPRSQLDYLELVQRFDTFFVSHVKALASDALAQLVLFIRFVDVLYDEGIKLVLLSEVALEAIYLDGPMAEPFKRTLSRLKEMQSYLYWQKPTHMRG